VKIVKKLIFILVLIVLIVIGIFSKIYLSAVAPVKIAEKKAIAFAEKKVHISKVDDFHLFHGIETVDVIEAENKQGEKIIIWISEKTKKMVIKKAENGLTKAEAIHKLKESKNPKKIISVRLGMEKNIPLWEIYYLSNNNLIKYVYLV
jgi:uncharacterized protein YpmB